MIGKRLLFKIIFVESKMYLVYIAGTVHRLQLQSDRRFIKRIVILL